jgi:hypothetical protein
MPEISSNPIFAQDVFPKSTNVSLKSTVKKIVSNISNMADTFTDATVRMAKDSGNAVVRMFDGIGDRIAKYTNDFTEHSIAESKIDNFSTGKTQAEIQELQKNLEKRNEGGFLRKFSGLLSALAGIVLCMTGIGTTLGIGLIAAGLGSTLKKAYANRHDKTAIMNRQTEILANASTVKLSEDAESVTVNGVKVPLLNGLQELAYSQKLKTIDLSDVKDPETLKKCLENLNKKVKTDCPSSSVLDNKEITVILPDELEEKFGGLEDGAKKNGVNAKFILSKDAGKNGVQYEGFQNFFAPQNNTTVSTEE